MTNYAYFLVNILNNGNFVLTENKSHYITSDNTVYLFKQCYHDIQVMHKTFQINNMMYNFSNGID